MSKNAGSTRRVSTTRWVALAAVLLTAGALLTLYFGPASLDGSERTANTGTLALPQAQEPPRYQQSDFESDPAVIQQLVNGGVPGDRWKEGLLFDGIAPQPWLKSAANWFPGTEEVQPDEMRITFMGTAPMIRPGQMNTSILVELGNGEKFIFDIGEGSISNYLAAGLSLNELNNVFLTHLHVDHFGSLPYLYVFGAWAGRWHEPLRVFGPSGRTEQDGVAYMVEGMKMMTHWHQEAFSVFPIGRGWEIEVTEFDYQDDGGVIYDRNGVRVIHWRRSHAKDGASAYRLDWNGLSFVWTGDGRPSELDARYAAGADVYVTENQAELVAISSGVQGVPPFLGRYTIDTHHTPGYALGYLCDQVGPRICMTTHMPFDPYLNEEVVAEVREHWNGPFHFGAPDGIVVNVTQDQIWVREGILPDYPNQKAPNAMASVGLYDGLVVPVPQYQRKDLQQQSIRDAELDPALYYPEGYHPELLQEWPTDKPIFIPEAQVPAGMLRNRPR